MTAAATSLGLSALVIDTDPQATASRSSQWRQGREPDVVDRGAPSLLADKLAKLADLALIPGRPKAFDLAAVEATAELIRSSGKPSFVVFTGGRLRPR